HGPAVDRRGQAGDVGDVEVGHPGQLLDRHPLDGVDVRLAGALRGDADAQLAGVVPAQPGLLAEHLGEVAEERHALERVPHWPLVCPTGIVGRWHPDPTAAWWWSQAPRARSAAGSAPGRRRTPRSPASSPSTSIPPAWPGARSRPSGWTWPRPTS